MCIYQRCLKYTFYMPAYIRWHMAPKKFIIYLKYDYLIDISSKLIVRPMSEILELSLIPGTLHLAIHVFVYKLQRIFIKSRKNKNLLLILFALLLQMARWDNQRMLMI